MQFLGLRLRPSSVSFPHMTVAQRVLASLRIPEAITNSATGFLQPTGLPFSLGEAIVPSSRTPVTQDTHYTFGCPPCHLHGSDHNQSSSPLGKNPPSATTIEIQGALSASRSSNVGPDVRPPQHPFTLHMRIGATLRDLSSG